jgi:hypothetical protein
MLARAAQVTVLTAQPVAMAHMEQVAVEAVVGITTALRAVPADQDYFLFNG